MFSVYRSRCYFDPLQFNELGIHCKPCFYVDPQQFFVKKIASFCGETKMLFCITTPVAFGTILQ